MKDISQIPIMNKYEQGCYDAGYLKARGEYEAKLDAALAQNAALTSEVEVITANRDGWKHMTDALRERREFLLAECAERITENKRLQAENARMREFLNGIMERLPEDNLDPHSLELEIEAFLAEPQP